jgi:peptidoglycan hydrolase-like protein with peptidoglycan-binding domain
MLRLAAAAALTLPLMLASAQAQTPQPAPDPALAKAQAAFEALPEPERRQIQLDLTFAVDFSGAALGAFGPLTYRGIQAFERLNKSTVDGVLEAPERAALAAAAKRERDRVGFRTVTDPASKAAIGLPTTLLPKAELQAAGGARWQSADGKATVAMRAPKPEEGTLEQLYEKALVSPNPQRKVTYKLLRPDFYVIAGETPQGKFFQRLAKLPDGSLRGFTVSYDKALAPVWDKMTVAAANSFQPGGAASAATASARPATPPPPPDPLAPRTFQPSLTAVVVAPGRALTAAAAFKACAQPRVGGQSARLTAEDVQAGLALIVFDSGSAAPLAAAIQAGGEGVGILASGAGPDGSRTLLVLSGELSGASLSAPLQPGAAGAPVFGQAGLAGIVLSDPSARLQVAGVVLAARHRVADAAAVERFLKAQNIALPAGQPPGVQLGKLSQRHGRSIVGITCG